MVRRQRRRGGGVLRVPAARQRHRDGVAARARVNLFNAWTQLGPFTHRYGHVIVKGQGPGRWSVRHNDRIIVGGLPSLEDAKRYAEHLDIRETAKMFSDPNAKWRTFPMSAKQQAFLVKHRIRHAPRITKGQAAELIDAKVRSWKRVA